MAKMKILFDGFADLAEAVDRAGGNLKETVDEALNKSGEVVKEELIPAAAVYDRKGLKGYATGKMYRSMIKDTNVKWKGTIAEIGTGFSGTQGTLAGFMHSIFVMYGTPRMAKDPKIYNAIKGTKVRKEIAKVQEDVMQKHLKLAKGD